MFGSEDFLMKNIEKNHYLFRVLEQREGKPFFIVEYLLNFKKNDFLQECIDEWEEDLLRRENYNTYVIDIPHLEHIAKLMNCDVYELLVQIFQSCTVIEVNCCDQDSLSLLSGTVQSAYDYGTNDRYLSLFFEQDMDNLKEILKHFNIVLNESFLNTTFLTKYKIDISSFMIRVETDTAKDEIKNKKLERKYELI